MTFVTLRELMAAERFIFRGGGGENQIAWRLKLAMPLEVTTGEGNNFLTKCSCYFKLYSSFLTYYKEVGQF